MAAGHDCLVYATTYHGEQMAYQGMTVIGGNGDYRGDLMGEYAVRFNADAILTLKDPYTYNHGTIRSLPKPWIAAVPVDTEPVSTSVLTNIAFATARLALTPNGLDLLKQRDIQAYYTPLGVDTTYWCPGDRQEARATLGLPPDAFVAAFVGANQTYPSRKAIEQLLLAWAVFVLKHKDTHPDAVLYLHTRMGPEFGGYHLDPMIAMFDIPARNWRTVDQVAYQGGYIARDHVRAVYRAADVLLSPSTGEGFCLPLVEAQACGIPGIAMDWTATRDTLWSGWKITRDHAELEWEPSGGLRLRVHGHALAYAIEQAAQARGTDLATRLATLARDGAAQYDFNHVITDYWLPVLETLEGLLCEGKVTHGTIRHDAPAVEPASAVGCDASRSEPETHRMVG
jgi:glycosyltransferase involved in cell wall biosynthesis